MFSDLVKDGRDWQKEDGPDNQRKPKNRLTPCSITNYCEIFRNSVLSKQARRADKNAKEAPESEEYFEALKDYDVELKGLKEKIWQNEHLEV
jgi:hypothetical protein